LALFFYIAQVLAAAIFTIQNDLFGG